MNAAVVHAFDAPPRYTSFAGRSPPTAKYSLKGKVARTYKNRAYHYEPAVSRAGVANVAVRDLVTRLFGGEPERLVMSMIETEQLTPAKIADLQRLLDDALKSSQ